MYLKQRLKQISLQSGLLKKVGFFIVGAEKSGTTSVHNALCAHPQVKPGAFKELHFWNPNQFNGPANQIEYRSLYPILTKPKDILIDSTPDYLNHTQVPVNILRYNKNAKFLILLRDPIQRLYSAHRMYHNSFPPEHTWREVKVHDPRRLDEAIQEELTGRYSDSIPEYFQRPLYLRLSSYSGHIKNYQSIIPATQLQISIVEEDVYNTTNDFLQSLISWLGLQEHPLSLPHANQSKNAKQTQQLPQKAIDILKADAERTKSLLHREIPSWDV